MNMFRVSQLSAVTALAVFGASVGWDRAVFAQPDQASEQEGVEVLTRGPVHEAFAQTVTFNAEPGIVVSKAPPEAIEELPPDQKPEGDNVAWIPGYWAWDDDRSDFLWVSGIWRALPPGRQWVPGYWGQTGKDFQWTSGYWADARLSEREYLPEPPTSVEAGPNIVAPSADHLWTPGCWVWNENRYAWRPGYWVVAQQNWVWVPAQYLWSPRGYVFVDGYYDYSVARRGVLFAPVYFNQSVYAQQGFTYSPAMAISLAVFGNQLFLRPNYNHYYYGDYYASNYSTAGFYPWFSFNSGRHGYDPFYAQQRWQHRDNREWEQRVESDFRHRRDHEEARPPRTLAAQQTLIKSGNTTNVNNIVVATSLDQMAKSKDAPVRFQAVNREEKQKLVDHGKDVRQFRSERQKLEAKPAESSVETPAKDFKPTRVKLPTSPILAKSSDQLDKNDAPPKRHEAPAPDLKIEPKPRTVGVQVESPKGEPKVPKAEPKVPKADTIPEPPKGRPKDEPKVDPKPIPRDPLKATPKVERQPERPKVEPKPIPKDEPKPAPRVEPKPAPRVEPKPVPKVEPQPTPRVEPKPTPKVEPKPERPRVEPKPAPRVEPKPAPRVEPKPAPRVEPKPERPRTEPKPAPRVEPKREPQQDKPRAKDDKPKGDDKPKK